MIRNCVLGIFLLAVCGFATAAEPAGTWKAGTGRIVITPDNLMWMSGYSARTKPAEGKEHDLWAKALVLEDPTGQKAVLVTMDLVGIERSLAQAVCQELQEKHGLARERILLNVSHTHCGPVVRGNLESMYFLDEKQAKLVRDYGLHLRRKLVDVVGAALKDLAPAQISWGTGYVTFATNRRNNPEKDVPKRRDLGQLVGPVDHDVPVLAVRAQDGKLRAIVCGYACHATTLDYYKWNGDYPGFTQIALEERYPGAIAMFWAGCGADQNPIPRRLEPLAERYGKELAAGVQTVLNAPMQPIRGNLQTKYTEIELPFSDLPTRDQLVQDTMNSNRYIASRARLLLEELGKKGSLRGTYPYPIQTWQLGDLTWVALGGEVVVDYVLRLKRELTPGRTWVAGYSNDVMAYIPSLRVLKEGGYEGGGAMVYYGLPTVWGPKVEELIVAAVKDQAKALQSKP